MRLSRSGFLLLALSTIVGGINLRAETVVYVSEAGEKQIAIYSLDESAGTLTRKGELALEGAPGAQALSADHRHLYVAVRSTKQFATLAIDPKTGQLAVVATAPAAGNPVYLQPDKTGKWLLAAYYGEGLVSVSRIRQEGIVEGEPICTLDVGPKAHCIVTDATNRFAFSPHPLPLNCVDQLRFDEEIGQLTRNAPPAMEGAEGAGPRHIKFHPSGKWAYVVNEEGKSVTHCDYDATSGKLTRKATYSTHPFGWDPESGSGAEIQISKDGRFVYASNRGHDSLASFTVDPETGTLTELERVPTAKTPRAFNLMPGEKFVIAAGQGDHHLALYRRDPESGRLKQVQTLTGGKTPVWVTGLRLP